jgi:pyruvate/2-oxoglutarate dehydrogenase complex dihydrolipoamide dehydrogenase (E3) component
LTSDTVLSLRELTESLTVIGGGQIAAEHEHLLSALGGRVPILGRNSRSLPGEGPVQVLVERGSLRLLGADVVGPRASVLLQGVASLMYTPDQSAWPILQGMHIHPALSEGVERAFFSLAPPGGQNGH